MKIIFFSGLFILAFTCSFTGREAPVEEGGTTALPASFVDGLVLVRPVTSDGDTLTFLTDTGGSLLIYEDAVQRMNLETVSTRMQGMPIQAIFLPGFRTEAAIPPPLFTNEMIKLRRQGDIPPHLRRLPDHDGTLGQAWFADRVWTFDYSEEKLWLHSDGYLPGHNPEDLIELGFQTTSDGARQNNFPRIMVGIAGEINSLVLQTGGAIFPAAQATSLVQGNQQWMSSSFISESIFEIWRDKHPEWRVIEDADGFYGAPMIEVPNITIGNVSQGPVWFTKRRDFAYMEWMSRYTDEPVVGALGGNALHNLRITLDYVNARAIVQQPDS